MSGYSDGTVPVTVGQYLFTLAVLNIGEHGYYQPGTSVNYPEMAVPFTRSTEYELCPAGRPTHLDDDYSLIDPQVQALPRPAAQQPKPPPPPQQQQPSSDMSAIRARRGSVRESITGAGCTLSPAALGLAGASPPDLTCV